MKQFIIAILLLITFPAVLLSCSKSKPTETENPEPGANYMVKGKVLDQAGNPVAGAKVRAQNTTGANLQVEGHTKADGSYSLNLSFVGGWTIYAWKETEINGNIYYFRMGMPSVEDYEAFTPGANPVIKNFVWKSSGRIPDRTISKENGTGYFGGTIRFTNFNSLTPEMNPGTEVSITFTPVDGATFPDGSSAQGKVVTKTISIVGGVGQAYYVNDIPFTKYSISAKANGKAIKLGANDTDNFFDKHTYIMPTAGGTSLESGIGSPNEHSFYMKQ